MTIRPAYVYTTAAAIILGANAPIMKLALEQFPVSTLAFVRMAIASLILGIIIFRHLRIQKKHFLSFFFSALTGATLNLGLFFLGLKLTEAILAAFLIAAVPIFTLFASHIYFKEKLTHRLIFASIIAVVGVAIIVGRTDGPSSTGQLIGNILLLASSAVWVAYEMISKKLLKIYSGETVAFYTMSIGALTFLPLFLLDFLRHPNWFNSVDIGGLWALFYGIIFTSLIGYIVWLKGLKKLAPAKAAFFFYLDPISGAIAAMILLGEHLTPTLIVGGILITAAVLLAERRRRIHPLHREVVKE